MLEDVTSDLQMLGPDDPTMVAGGVRRPGKKPRISEPKQKPQKPAPGSGGEPKKDDPVFMACKVPDLDLMHALASVARAPSTDR